MRLLFATTIIMGLAAPHWALARQPLCDPAADIKTVRIQADHPLLMAIGDSIYNGVESLSLTQPRVNLSIPNLVASRFLPQTAAFRIPQYPTPLLIDLDTDLRDSWIGILENTGNKTLDSIDAYANPHNPLFPKPQKFFDDIAVAQADSTALICDTAADANNFIWQTYPPHGAPKDVLKGDLNVPENIEQWFYSLNSRYILNPTQNPSYDNLSQLDEVLLRKPKTLLINIGSNDGVWLMAFNGYGPATCYSTSDADNIIAQCGTPGVTSIQIEINDLVANMELIAKMLKRFTPQTRVIVNLLPKPSAAGNLTPRLISEHGIPGGSPYFSTYENYLGLGGIHTLKGDDVAKMDAAVANANDQIVSRVCTVLSPTRVAFVDLYKLLQNYDYKNIGAPRLTVSLRVAGHIQPVTVDNRIVSADNSGIDQGGLFGYDNMHPTVIAYALVANTVLNTTSKLANLNVREKSSGCIREADDTVHITYQSVADKINGANARSQVSTAFQVDESVSRFLGLIHDILDYETSSNVSRTAEYGANLRRWLNIESLAIAPHSTKQASTFMHAVFRLGNYPSANRIHHKTCQFPEDNGRPGCKH